jgi:crotonobetaine/carnitine-CoA ligase
MSRVTHRDAGAPWSGVPRTTVVEIARRACERDPERPALIFEDGLVLTRRELLERAERFAAYLRDRVAPGDRVAIMLSNRAEFMIAWLAVVANRATLVSINTEAREYDAGHILRDSQAVLVIVGEEGYSLIQRLQAQCTSVREIVYVNGPEPHGLDAYTGTAERLPFAGLNLSMQDITNVYYTSGTTGVPKGCMLDHEYWARFVDLFLRLYGMRPDDRLLCCLRFFYGDPPWQFLASLHSGGSLVVMRRFSVSRFWDVVRRYDVTILFGIASIPSLLLKAEPGPYDRDHRVRYALQIGVPAHLHHQLVQRWGFPWVEGYGLTETGLVISMPLAYADVMTGSGSIGVPCPEVEVRVVDDQNSDVAVGQPGEILIKAPGLMQGYLNRPDATAETLRGGWLYTGDLGRADERGFLYFVGRKKDIIRRSGENIAAAEVEQVLRSHPKILEVAVLPVPDELRGEEVKAYILPVAGESQATLPPEEIIAYCAQRLAPYKVPRYIVYRTQDFPRTPSMRVAKDQLRQEPGDPIAGAWDREHELGW